MSEDKNTLLSTLAEHISNASNNITDKPTQNIGTTIADIWYLVFGGISQAAEKRKLKYSYDLQEFEKELKEKISKIPEDKVTEPDIQVVAPALEASKYCTDKEELRNLFSNLIESSMNIDFCDFIHPIFSTILQHLSVFDAKLFNIIYNNDTKSFMNLIKSNNAYTFPDFIGQLSSSFTVLRNYGLIYGTKLYNEYQIKNRDDMFNPNSLFHIIVYTLFYEDEDLQIELHKCSVLYDNTVLTYDAVYSEDDNLYFVHLTPLGENLGKCCCK